MIESEHKKPVFLLGGADLEMVTIRNLLMSENVEFVDRGLSWETASLSSYKEELNKYPAAEYDIYGIELRNDVDFIPDNYHEIDHHGNKDFLPSALEQVAALLEHELTLEESLIAANDKGYIRAMKSLLENSKEAEGMSEEEKEKKIIDIRSHDRKAQGITPEEEVAAEKEIAQGKCFVEGNLVIFQTSLDHLSPITDRLVRYDRIVVFNENKLVIYGLGCHIAGAEVAGHYSLNDKQTYSGGGPLGYWGIKEGELTKDEIFQIAETLKTLKMEYSGHIFYFPFSWHRKDAEGLNTLSQRVQMGELQFNLEGPWHKADSDENLYNEKNYFYPYVHNLLYDDDDGKSMIRHFELTCGENAKYVIKVRQGNGSVTYSLRLDHVNLNLYSTGAGLLSFYCTNDTNLCDENGTVRIMDKEDILRINQFGRRIMPPFFADIGYRGEIAEELAITGLAGFPELKEQFNNYSQNDYWKPASFIGKLIHSICHQIDFQPVIDDRMFVISWYKNTSLINEVKMDTHTWNHSSNDQFWYRYLYVDTGFPTCQDADMRAALLNASTYRRWMDMNSLYGLTRYSMVFLTSDSVPSHLIPTFETIYARMVEMVLMQRASLLCFSDEVTRVSALLDLNDPKASYEPIRSLYMEYIAFVNKFYHKEITAQDQGIELYDMMQRSLHLDEFVKDMDNDIGELYQYTSMLDDKEQGKKADHLNWVMSVFAPASFVAGIWGMNEMCDVCRSGTFLWQILWIAGFSVMVCMLIWFMTHLKRK